MSRGSRGPGTTSPRTCRSSPRRRSIRGPTSRSARTTSRRSSRWRSSGRSSVAEREIEIPEPVRDAYRLYRPSPLYRAHRLEAALDTPAHIYYKYEGGSPSGSHKPNTALAQAFYNKEEGVTRLATETGAGQWGSALAFAGAVLRPRGQGLHGPRQLRPEAVSPGPDGDLRRRRSSRAPASTPSYGRKVLGENPDHTGSLGMAISEAIEDTVTHPGHQVLARVGASTSSCSTRPSSARSRSTRWRWPARSRT